MSAERNHVAILQELSTLNDHPNVMEIGKRTNLFIRLWVTLVRSCETSSYLKEAFFTLLRKTTLSIFSPDWNQVAVSVKRDLVEHIMVCGHLLNQCIEGCLERCNEAKLLASEPWANPFSTWEPLLAGKFELDDYRVQMYVTHEPEQIITSRIHFLLLIGCEDQALCLAKYMFRYYNQAVRVEAKKFHQKPHEYPVCAPRKLGERRRRGDFTALEWFLFLLQRKKSLPCIIKATEGLDCHEGMEIITGLKENANSKLLVDFLIQVFVVQEVLEPKTNCCTKELFRLWCLSAKEKNLSNRQIAENSQKLFGRYAPTSAHIYIFVDVLWNQFGSTLLPLYTELFIRAFTTDINHLEVARNLNMKQELSELEAHLASMFSKLSGLFMENHKIVARECVLSAFSLRPTEDRLAVMKSLSENIFSDGYCLKDKNQVAGSNVDASSVNIFSALGINGVIGRNETPHYTKTYHPLLMKGVQNIPYALVKDMVIVLEGIRCNTFHFSVYDWCNVGTELDDYLKFFSSRPLFSKQHPEKDSFGSDTEYESENDYTASEGSLNRRSVTEPVRTGVYKGASYDTNKRDLMSVDRNFNSSFIHLNFSPTKKASSQGLSQDSIQPPCDVKSAQILVDPVGANIEIEADTKAPIMPNLNMSSSAELETSRLLSDNEMSHPPVLEQQSSDAKTSVNKPDVANAKSGSMDSERSKISSCDFEKVNANVRDCRSAFDANKPQVSVSSNPECANASSEIPPKVTSPHVFSKEIKSRSDEIHPLDYSSVKPSTENLRPTKVISPPVVSLPYKSSSHLVHRRQMVSSPVITTQYNHPRYLGENHSDRTENENVIQVASKTKSPTTPILEGLGSPRHLFNSETATDMLPKQIPKQSHPVLMHKGVEKQPVSLILPKRLEKPSLSLITKPNTPASFAGQPFIKCQQIIVQPGMQHISALHNQPVVSSANESSVNQSKVILKQHVQKPITYFTSHPSASQTFRLHKGGSKSNVIPVEKPSTTSAGERPIMPKIKTEPNLCPPLQNMNVGVSFPSSSPLMPVCSSATGFQDKEIKNETPCDRSSVIQHTMQVASSSDSSLSSQMPRIPVAINPVRMPLPSNKEFLQTYKINLPPQMKGFPMNMNRMLSANLVIPCNRQEGVNPDQMPQQMQPDTASSKTITIPGVVVWKRRTILSSSACGNKDSMVPPAHSVKPTWTTLRNIHGQADYTKTEPANLKGSPAAVVYKIPSQPTADGLCSLPSSSSAAQIPPDNMTAFALNVNNAPFTSIAGSSTIEQALIQNTGQGLSSRTCGEGSPVSTHESVTVPYKKARSKWQLSEFSRTDVSVKSKNTKLTDVVTHNQRSNISDSILATSQMALPVVVKGVNVSISSRNLHQPSSSLQYQNPRTSQTSNTLLSSNTTHQIIASPTNNVGSTISNSTSTQKRCVISSCAPTNTQVTSTSSEFFHTNLQPKTYTRISGDAPRQSSVNCHTSLPSSSMTAISGVKNRMADSSKKSECKPSCAETDVAINLSLSQHTSGSPRFAKMCCSPHEVHPCENCSPSQNKGRSCSPVIMSSLVHPVKPVSLPNPGSLTEKVDDQEAVKDLSLTQVISSTGVERKSVEADKILRKPKKMPTFKCDICNKLLSSRYTLKKHKQKLHNVIDQGIAKKGDLLSNSGTPFSPDKHSPEKLVEQQGSAKKGGIVLSNPSTPFSPDKHCSEKLVEQQCTIKNEVTEPSSEENLKYNSENEFSDLLPRDAQDSLEENILKYFEAFVNPCGTSVSPLGQSKDALNNEIVPVASSSSQDVFCTPAVNSSNTSKSDLSTVSSSLTLTSVTTSNSELNTLLSENSGEYAENELQSSWQIAGAAMHYLNNPTCVDDMFNDIPSSSLDSITGSDVPLGNYPSTSEPSCSMDQLLSSSPNKVSHYASNTYYKQHDNLKVFKRQIETPTELSKEYINRKQELQKSDLPDLFHSKDLQSSPATQSGMSEGNFFASSETFNEQSENFSVNPLSPTTTVPDMQCQVSTNTENFAVVGNFKMPDNISGLTEMPQGQSSNLNTVTSDFTSSVGSKEVASQEPKSLSNSKSTTVRRRKPGIPASCSICKKVLSSSVSVKRHIKAVHKDHNNATNDKMSKVFSEQSYTSSDSEVPELTSSGSPKLTSPVPVMSPDTIMNQIKSDIASPVFSSMFSPDPADNRPVGQMTNEDMLCGISSTEDKINNDLFSRTNSQLGQQSVISFAHNSKSENKPDVQKIPIVSEASQDYPNQSTLMASAAVSKHLNKPKLSVECNFCSKKFSSVTSQKRHFKNVHKEKPKENEKKKVENDEECAKRVQSILEKISSETKRLNEEKKRGVTTAVSKKSLYSRTNLNPKFVHISKTSVPNVGPVGQRVINSGVSTVKKVTENLEKMNTLQHPKNVTVSNIQPNKFSASLVIVQPTVCNEGYSTASVKSATAPFGENLHLQKPNSTFYLQNVNDVAGISPESTSQYLGTPKTEQGIAGPYETFYATLGDNNTYNFQSVVSHSNMVGKEFVPSPSDSIEQQLNLDLEKSKLPTTTLGLESLVMQYLENDVGEQALKLPPFTGGSSLVTEVSSQCFLSPLLPSYTTSNSIAVMSPHADLNAPRHVPVTVSKAHEMPASVNISGITEVPVTSVERISAIESSEFIHFDEIDSAIDFVSESTSDQKHENPYTMIKVNDGMTNLKDGNWAYTNSGSTLYPVAVSSHFSSPLGNTSANGEPLLSSIHEIGVSEQNISYASLLENNADQIKNNSYCSDSGVHLTSSDFNNHSMSVLNSESKLPVALTDTSPVSSALSTVSASYATLNAMQIECVPPCLSNTDLATVDTATSKILSLNSDGVRDPKTLSLNSDGVRDPQFSVHEVMSEPLITSSNKWKKAVSATSGLGEIGSQSVTPFMHIKQSPTSSTKSVIQMPKTPIPCKKLSVLSEEQSKSTSSAICRMEPTSSNSENKSKAALSTHLKNKLQNSLSSCIDSKKPSLPQPNRSPITSINKKSATVVNSRPVNIGHTILNKTLQGVAKPGVKLVRLDCNTLKNQNATVVVPRVVDCHGKQARLNERDILNVSKILSQIKNQRLVGTPSNSCVQPHVQDQKPLATKDSHLEVKRNKSQSHVSAEKNKLSDVKDCKVTVKTDNQLLREKNSELLAKEENGKLSVKREKNGKLSVKKEKNGKLSVKKEEDGKLSVKKEEDGKLSVKMEEDGKLSVNEEENSKFVVNKGKNSKDVQSFKNKLLIKNGKTHFVKNEGKKQSVTKSDSCKLKSHLDVKENENRHIDQSPEINHSLSEEEKLKHKGVMGKNGIEKKRLSNKLLIKKEKKQLYVKSVEKRPIGIEEKECCKESKDLVTVATSSRQLESDGGKQAPEKERIRLIVKGGKNQLAGETLKSKLLIKKGKAQLLLENEDDKQMSAEKNVSSKTAGETSQLPAENKSRKSLKEIGEFEAEGKEVKSSARIEKKGLSVKDSKNKKREAKHPGNDTCKQDKVAKKNQFHKNKCSRIEEGSHTIIKKDEDHLSMETDENQVKKDRGQQSAVKHKRKITNRENNYLSAKNRELSTNESTVIPPSADESSRTKKEQSELPVSNFKLINDPTDTNIAGNELHRSRGESNKKRTSEPFDEIHETLKRKKELSIQASPRASSPNENINCPKLVLKKIQPKNPSDKNVQYYVPANKEAIEHDKVNEKICSESTDIANLYQTRSCVVKLNQIKTTGYNNSSYQNVSKELACEKAEPKCKKIKTVLRLNSKESVHHVILPNIVKDGWSSHPDEELVSSSSQSVGTNKMSVCKVLLKKLPSMGTLSDRASYKRSSARVAESSRKCELIKLKNPSCDSAGPKLLRPRQKKMPQNRCLRRLSNASVSSSSPLCITLDSD